MGKKGWVVTFAGVGINFALGILYAWSVFSKHLTEPLERGGFGWTRTQATLPYTIAIACFAFMKVPAGAVLGFLVRLASFGVKRRLCAGIPFPVDRPRDGAVKTESMTEEQMTAYMKAATAQETGVVGTFLAFDLLTGMRMNEVRNLMWSAVNLENGGVHIRNPKGGRDQFIPLNDAARGILRHPPRDPENPFVFQGEMDKKGTEGRGKRPKSGRIAPKSRPWPPAACSLRRPVSGS